jgi:hypothetical protein
MAEDTLKNLVIGFMLFTLIGILVLTAVNEFGNDYDMDMTEVAGGSMSYNSFYNNATIFEEDMKDLKKAFDKQNVWSAIAGVVVEGIFGIGKNLAVMIFAPFDLLNDILQDVFKVPSIVSSVILGIIILVVMLAIWQLLKVGN